MDDNFIPLTEAPDGHLVAWAREGDRTAFGVLYLRHHAAAWRVASITSGFSDDAEVAVIEGFTKVFSVLPRNPVECSFRPYLLASVRQVALERGHHRPRRHTARREDAPVDAEEIVLDDDHLVREALRELPERRRTALWLSDVEAMTPREVAGFVELEPDAVPALVAEVRGEIREACLRTYERSEPRAGCRFTVDHLGPYLEGGLDQTDRQHVQGHLERCITCRVRRTEVANLTPSLISAVAEPPTLGGECQRHWMTHRRSICGARRPLPPGRAAARFGGGVPVFPVQGWSPALVLVAAVFAVLLGVPRLEPSGAQRSSAATAQLTALGGSLTSGSGDPPASDRAAVEIAAASLITVASLEKEAPSSPGGASAPEPEPAPEPVPAPEPAPAPTPVVLIPPAAPLPIAIAAAVPPPIENVTPPDPAALDRPDRAARRAAREARREERIARRLSERAERLEQRAQERGQRKFLRECEGQAGPCRRGPRHSSA